VDKRTCMILTATSLVVCACCAIIGQYVAAGVMGVTAAAAVAVFRFRDGRSR
jgi:hypothetical protein